MTRVILALLFCLAAGATSAEPAAADLHAPVPDWVDWKPLPEPPEGPAGGDRIALLNDDQISLLGDQSRRFYRRASRVASAAGVASAGDFSISYDPAHEKVRLHGIWVERKGVRSDRLASARIDTLRRESGLESGLLDGQLTLHVVLDDIRVGDIVDFAASVEGDNPALAGIFRQHYWFTADLPTRQRQVRILRPAARELVARVSGDDIEHARVQLDAGIDERWILRDLGPRPGEERVPPWYFSGPQLEIADPLQWRDVVEWALPLYDGRAPEAIAALARELGLEAGQADEAAVLEAIRFVQDEIRYTGLELGAHAYRPYPPATVLQRRYGDCKDKAALLVALLRHLGLEAHPALVDVDDRAEVAARLPGPQAFDHVILRFEFEGREHWVDATATHQRGDLAHRVAPPYRRALLLAPGEDGLRDIPFVPLDGPRIDIRETIDLRAADGGLAEDGDYRITTIYRGASAERQRARFATQSPAVIGQDYVEAIAPYYPNLRLASEPVASDDPVANEVTVEEHYVLPGVWGKRVDDRPGSQADFWLTEVDRALALPKAVARRDPWHLGDPVDIRQRLEVLLDAGWPPEHETHAIRNPHFSYEGEVRNDGDRFVMEGRVRTHSTVVPASDLATLRSDIEQLSDDVSYALLLGEAGVPDVASWFDARALVVLLGIVLWWAAIVACAFSRSVVPLVGMWFRPRATARAGIDADRHVLAFVLLASGGAVSAALDESFLAPVAEGRLGFALFLFGAGVFGSMIGGAISAVIYAWVGRLFGGEGRSDDLLVVSGYAQVPMIALLPLLLLALMLYGPNLMLGPAGPMLAPLVLLGLLALLPAIGWTLVVWVAALSEAHRFGTGRALFVTFAPLLVVVLVVGVFVAFK